MAQEVLSVPEVTCQHCVNALEGAVGAPVVHEYDLVFEACERHEDVLEGPIRVLDGLLFVEARDNDRKQRGHRVARRRRCGGGRSGHIMKSRPEAVRAN